MEEGSCNFCVSNALLFLVNKFVLVKCVSARTICFATQFIASTYIVNGQRV